VGRYAPLVVLISGLDPTGGAGLFADIRACASAGVRIAPLISVVTAQGKAGLSSFHPIPFKTILEQLTIIFNEHKPAAIKVGAVGSIEIVKGLAAFLKDSDSIPVVLDPVWKVSAGGRLAGDDIREALLSELLPETRVVTPNIDELFWLTNMSHRRDSIHAAAAGLIKTGVGAVLVKGGHLTGHPVDVLYTKNSKYKFSGVRLKGSLRGTGCHLSSYLASQLAIGKPLTVAVRRSRTYVRKLFQDYYGVGRGIKPAWHRESKKS